MRRKSTPRRALAAIGTAAVAVRAGPSCVPRAEDAIMAVGEPGPANDLRSQSRTRDHLANERTFLAWVRTALGLIGLGFVLARMGLFLRQLAEAGGRPAARGLPAGHEFFFAGIVFLLLGTILSGWSGWHYDLTRRAIDEDRYEPTVRTVLILTVTSVVGGLVIVGLVIWKTPG